ncbi:MAG TPA: hypothetical protein VIF15_18380 [Polyangiaceae bacterium]
MSRLSSLRGLALAAFLAGCGGGSDGAGGADPGPAGSDDAEAADALVGLEAQAGDGGLEPDASSGADAHAHPDAHAPSDAGKDAHAEAGPTCAKHLTVVFSVGVGAGALAGHSSGCWTVVDADGAANHAFRKCSTGSFVVQNPGAASYAYDDTNPTRALSQDQSFLAQCSSGATGDGYEYMAYRGSWRILPAPNLRAYFAELYGGAVDDVDSYLTTSGVYQGNAQLAAHKNVYPMINIGPSAGAHLEKQIGADTLSLCKKIADGGYFGTYVATWQSGMSANDPRILAVADALDQCTK